MDWNNLRCASGSAAEVGVLLDCIEAGEDVWSDLIGEVLHQGSMFDSTPPAVSWVIRFLLGGGLPARTPPARKSRTPSQHAWAFVFLAGAAGAAGFDRTNPLANAVRQALREGIPLFERGLADAEIGVRLASSAIWKVAAADAAAAFSAIFGHYASEPNAEVRVAMLSALDALSTGNREWPERLLSIQEASGSPREKFYAAAFYIRQIGAGAPSEVAAQMAELYATLPEEAYPIELTGVEEPDEIFWSAARALNRPAAVVCLARSLQSCPVGDRFAGASKIVSVVEWLLRIAAGDSRKGWAGKTRSRGPAIEYFQVPPFDGRGDWLRTSETSVALAAIAGKDAFWLIQTNLLALFGLPATRFEFRRLFE